MPEAMAENDLRAMAFPVGVGDGGEAEGPVLCDVQDTPACSLPGVGRDPGLPVVCEGNVGVGTEPLLDTDCGVEQDPV